MSHKTKPPRTNPKHEPRNKRQNHKSPNHQKAPNHPTRTYYKPPHETTQHAPTTNKPPHRTTQKKTATHSHTYSYKTTTHVGKAIYYKNREPNPPSPPLSLTARLSWFRLRRTKNRAFSPSFTGTTASISGSVKGSFPPPNRSIRDPNDPAPPPPPAPPGPPLPSARERYFRSSSCEIKHEIYVYNEKSKRTYNGLP